MPSTSKSDLISTRTDIRESRSNASREMDRCIAVATSPACNNVFLRRMFDEARALAQRPELRAAPLAGLAVSVKDLFDIEGQTTMAGSRTRADMPAALSDCPAVDRLRRAGAAFIGRTNMTEFAFSGVGVNPHFGTPSNAASRSEPLIPGGSSSGAAVSVATGAAFIGLGSDTGGSIRIPAALNGIVGFKNTARLVPISGAIPLSTTLDTVCAMTRSVRDAIVAHEILAARSVTRSSAPLAAYRLAVVRTMMQDDMDATVSRTFEQALSRLRDGGATIAEIDLAELGELPALMPHGAFAGAESFAFHRKALERVGEQYDQRVVTRIRRGAAMSAADYIDLQQCRADWIARVAQRLQTFDAVLSPTVPIVAPSIASVAPGASRDEEFFRNNALLLRNTNAINMLDGCALSLPCQQGQDLPVGLMVWNTAMHDDAVLAIGLEVERLLAVG